MSKLQLFWSFKQWWRKQSCHVGCTISHSNTEVK